MDQVKTRTPFWKKEHRASGDRWVEAKTADDSAAARWQAKAAE
jgi:molybdopterin synthase catalytic subunit